MPHRSIFCLCLSLHILLVSHSSAAEDIRFNRDIRPILSAKCGHCHGPDDAHREADLRLDQAEGVTAAFSGGLDDSLAWERIITDDPDLKMPPADSHQELEPKEIATLKRWVEQGAEYEGHWSFIAPEKPPVPEVSRPDWVKNPIDAFILQRLEAAGLSPSPEADKERLLRRVTFDLTGLPPTIDEIDAFLNDDSEDAYERVVDRLLMSPHYGERMAVTWMDAARYGDTSVFHADGPRDMWPWRDWVIDAYNSNKSFQDFTIEQLAGDLLPEATTPQKVATGFLRNNATTDEGGAIAEEFRVEYAVDRVKTVSMVWLGLSMECAQCHNHKYDPISQEEYYQFFAYFNQASDPGMQTRNGNQSPIVDLYDEQNLAEAETFKPQIEQLQAEQESYKSTAQPAFESWLADAVAQAGDAPLVPADMVLHVTFDQHDGNKVPNEAHDKQSGEIRGPVEFEPGQGGQAIKLKGNNYVDFDAAADFERTDQFSYGCWIKPEQISDGAPLARMNNNNAYRGYDMLLSGGAVEVHIVNTWPTNAVKVRTKKQLKANAWQHLFVTYDGSSKASGITIYVDGQPQEWEIQQDRLSETIRAQVPFAIGRRNPGSNFKGLIDDVRVYPRELAETEVAALAGTDLITPLLVKQDRTEDDLQTLQAHYFNTVDQRYQELSRQIADLEARIAELTKPYVNVMVMRDEPQMRSTFVLDRGNYASPDQDRPVQPGVPTILPPLPADAAANRLGLAEWLTSPDHPLVARVTVNRYWAQLFGRGLVKTLEDFGSQGEWPTHPELLDWLAVDFIEQGWNVKQTIKQIVMSSTYRQTSRLRPELLNKDPENTLLARGPRFRLQAEFIRDNALSAAGLLVPAVGGPGVKPYQPPGLWNEVSLSGNVRFEQDTGEKLYRRSLYTYWKRSSPAPMMTTFDVPTRETCTLRRARTNTPLQALVTMNDPQFVEAARVLAQRVIREYGPSLEARIVAAFRLSTGVRPSDSTLAILREAYETELAYFAAHPDEAAALVAIGSAPREESLDPAEHAALTAVMNIILNLDQTLTRS